MHEHLRICLIAGTLGLGGAERQLYCMVKTLTEHDIPCLVLCLTRDEPYEARLKALGVSVIWVGQSSSRLIRLMRIISEVRRWQPNIVQSAHSYTSLYAVLAAPFAKGASIAAVRNHGLREYTDSGYIGRLALTLSHSFVANSKPALESIVRKYPKKRVLFLDNVVDSSYFKPKIDSKSKLPLQILNVGRLWPQKRQDLFLQVVSRVRHDHDKMRARIVGDGPQLTDLKRLAVALEVDNYIDFSGSCRDMVDVYNAADILVNTSDFEGTPNVILEAMACGLPVVATRAGGSPDLVAEGETGFLADCGDVETLAQYLSRLLDDEALRRKMGQAARERAIADYGYEHLYNRLVNMYREILQK